MFWRKKKPTLPWTRAELEQKSLDELKKLERERYWLEREPELREEERKLGTPNWDTLTRNELTDRFVDRWRKESVIRNLLT